MSATTTSWSSAAGWPAPRPRCCSPGPALRVALLDRAAYGSDTLSTHGLMRAGVLQLSRWGLLDGVVAAGTPPIRRTSSTTPTASRCRSRSARAPAWTRLRAAPHRARPDPGRRGRRGRRRRAARDDGDRAAARRPTAACAACGARTAPERRRARGRGHGRRRRHPLGRRAAGRRARRCGRGGRPAPCSTATSRTSPATATSGRTATAAAAGLIPTNDGETCVFVATTPRADARPAPGGRRAAFDDPARRRGPGAGRPASPRRPRRPPARLGRRAGLRPPVVGARVGAGRRRRLLQGPDHHPRHDRRAA